MANKTILLAEKDEEIRKSLKQFFHYAGYSVRFLESDDNVYDRLEELQPVILLLDTQFVISREREAAEVADLCKAIRSCSDVPILLLSAVPSMEEMVQGLDSGADGYMVKPFDLRELWARIKALLRRTSGLPMEFRKIIDWPTLHIDTKEGITIAFGRAVELTKMDQRLFTFLAANPNKLFSRQQLIKAVWEFDSLDEGRIVDAHIKIIRQRLKIPADSPWNIITKWGKGYKLQLKGV